MTFTKYHSPENQAKRDEQDLAVKKFSDLFYIHLGALRREYPEPHMYVSIEDSFSHKLGRLGIRSFTVPGKRRSVVFRLGWGNSGLVVFELDGGDGLEDFHLSATQRDPDTLNWIAYKVVQHIFSDQIKETKCNQQCSTKVGALTLPVSPAATVQTTPRSGTLALTQQTNSTNKSKGTQ